MQQCSHIALNTNDFTVLSFHLLSYDLKIYLHLHYLMFCSPQDLWYPPVCGERSASHGCSGVCPHDDFPQQGADGWESDTEGGQPAERGHCAEAKVIVPSSGYVLSQHSEFPAHQETHGLEDFLFLFSLREFFFPHLQFCDGVYLLDITEIKREK